MARTVWPSAALILVALGCAPAAPAASDEPSRLAPSTHAQPAANAPNAPGTAATGADPFTASVRPVLAKSCAPCHEPAGKMYEKLPFDNASVVASHSEGVLRRLKGSDKEAVERWLATLPAEKKASAD
jgi:hypothetical protein